MKLYPLLLCLLLGTASLSAQQPYYDDVDLSLTGQALYLELQQKISVANNTYSYGQVRDDVKITDEDPSNSSNVLLVYGFNDSDGDCMTDRSRDKDDFGGTGCEYNREHVFARSNADPPMGSADNSSTGIVADPHNIRPSDQAMNGFRGSKKFASGSGNAGDVGSGNWYPGDEWKGDIARMMMYMYTRYGDRCLPELNGAGSTQGSTDMLLVYLQWNADDPVNEFEDQRNPHLETVYGNRNPFIDNPYLATLIWGGPIAEDRWGLANTQDFEAWELHLSPNPATEVVQVQSEWDLDSYTLYNAVGQSLQQGVLNAQTPSISIETLSRGVYFIEFNANGAKQVERLLIE